MLGVSCSPFSIATLFITPFSALGIWRAVHPGKCQQYGICYTYWSWYTVENNGPNFKRHGAKNRACCNMQTVNLPWMSCLKTKRAVFFITFVAWFVFWRCCKWKILRSDEYRLDLRLPDAGTTDSAETRGSARAETVAGSVPPCTGEREQAGKAGTCGTCPPGTPVPRAARVSRGEDRQGRVLPTPVCAKGDGDGGCPDAFAGVIRGSH